MIATLGQAALWLATLLALAQLVLGVQALRSPDGPAARRIIPAAVAQAVLCGFAFLALMTLFIQSDFSVLLVAANSHSAKPMLYKIAGTWGNHEGSMLLWVAILSVAGGMIALFERKLRADTKIATLAAQGAIALGFYAFLILASNPFTRVEGVMEGNGLNPLLQDPGLAFHPPTLYMGYVGMSAAFSFAVGALVTRNVSPEFARAMRPWILGAWIFLTIGITAGSYWAYYELGWGGWWFWDPVENASLMPWLAATALLHSVSVLATRDGLRAWTIMLAVVAFAMSMIGTFLVRSGILTSVHSFAVDPERGLFILTLLALYIGGALTLFGWRIATVTEGARFDMVSREGALVINNLLLCVILVIVLFGTIYPLALKAVTGGDLPIGAPYFNALTGPIALAMFSLMAIGPLMRWRSDRARAVLGRALVPLLVAVGVAIILLIAAPDLSPLPFFGLIVAGGVIVASVAPLWKRNLRRTPLYTWGMVLAHLGCGVSIAGIAAETSFTQANLVAMKPGETQKVGPFAVTLHDVRDAPGPNYAALAGLVSVRRGDGAIIPMSPQLHQYRDPPMITKESAIKTFWDGQLYLVLGEPDEQGRWLLRMWWKPFVTLIWLGGVLIALGGFLSLIGRVRRDVLGARS